MKDTTFQANISADKKKHFKKLNYEGIDNKSLDN